MFKENPAASIYVRALKCYNNCPLSFFITRPHASSLHAYCLFDKKNGTAKVMHHCSLFINEDAETQKTRRRDVKDVKLDEGGQKVLT